MITWKQMTSNNTKAFKSPYAEPANEIVCLGIVSPVKEMKKLWIEIIKIFIRFNQVKISFRRHIIEVHAGSHEKNYLKKSSIVFYECIC